MRILLIVAPLFLVVACQRDPGRDVRPLADPLRTDTGSAAAPTEIIPLEKVQKSQAAAVSQGVANTEITVTYSRPVARGRALFGALVPFDRVWNPGAEVLTFYFPLVEGKDAVLRLHWGEIMVPLSIRVP
jgi:hypothetical protein